MVPVQLRLLPFHVILLGRWEQSELKAGLERVTAAAAAAATLLPELCCCKSSYGC